MLKDEGFLGTGATLGADVNLLAYVLLLVPLMLIGFYFARGKRFRNHKYVMTTVMLGNWVLIALIMTVSYSDNVASGVPERLDDSFFLSPTVHAAIALTAQIIATYLVIRMWFEKRLPSWLLVKNFKPWMRLTLGMWLTAAVLGIVTYALWYLDDEAVAEVQENEVSLQNFAYNPSSLTIVRGTKVTWINNEAVPHTVTFDDGSVDSGELLEGATFSHIFEEVGTFPIHCGYHGVSGGGGMAMTVTVVESLEEMPPAVTSEATEAAATAEPTAEATLEATAEAAGAVEVVLAQFAYDPRELTIPAGTTVTWINNEAVPHTVTFDDNSVDSGQLNQGDSFSYTFDTPGTFPIHCAYHGQSGGAGMAMTVTVVEAGSEVPVTTPAPTEEAPEPTAAPTRTPAPTTPPTVQAQPTAAQTVEVALINSLFAPKILTISAGTTVIWTNREARVHTVTFDDGSVDSGDLAQNQQFEHIFSAPGTYRVYCRYHGGPGGLGMSMTITVE